MYMLGSCLGSKTNQSSMTFTQFVYPIVNLVISYESNIEFWCTQRYLTPSFLYSTHTLVHEIKVDYIGIEVTLAQSCQTSSLCKSAKCCTSYSLYIPCGVAPLENKFLSIILECRARQSHIIGMMYKFVHHVHNSS